MSRFFLGSKNTHCSQTSVLAGFRTRQTLHSLHIDEEKKNVLSLVTCSGLIMSSGTMRQVPRHPSIRFTLGVWLISRLGHTRHSQIATGFLTTGAGQDLRVYLELLPWFQGRDT